MKTLIFAVAAISVVTAAYGGSASDDMVIMDAQAAKLEGPLGDSARERIFIRENPQAPGETDQQYMARLAILKQQIAIQAFREKLRMENKLTPEMELAIIKQLNDLTAQLAALSAPPSNVNVVVHGR